MMMLKTISLSTKEIKMKLRTFESKNCCTVTKYSVYKENEFFYSFTVNYLTMDSPSRNIQQLQDLIKRKAIVEGFSVNKDTGILSVLVKVED